MSEHILQILSYPSRQSAIRNEVIDAGQKVGCEYCNSNLIKNIINSTKKISKSNNKIEFSEKKPSLEISFFGSLLNWPIGRST